MNSRCPGSASPSRQEGGRSGALSADAVESEARMRAILETAVEGIITIDERGIIESCNPAAERIFGYAAAEVRGRNVSMLMPSDVASQHDGYLRNYLETGQARIIGVGREVTGRRKDGTEFPLDLAVSEVNLPDRRLFTGFVRDITLRKEAEERLTKLARNLEEKNRELESVVYIASHDLRSPLVNIQGFSRELLHACHSVKEILGRAHLEEADRAVLERLLREDVAEALDFIQAGVGKMDTLLSGFLRFSRLGRVSMKQERLPLGEVVREVLKVMDFQIQESGAEVECGPLPEVRSDRALLNQVLTNLVDNALKYRHPDRPCRIHLEGGIRDGRAWVVVEDNGMGVPPPQRDKVFRMFYRLDPELGSGEGLGLSITQRILDRLDGQITLEESAAGGCRFLIVLPAPDGQSS